MAIQFWRQTVILLWICCFFLATYGAPFGDEVASKRSTRTRRVIRKAGHRRPGHGRNLVRYRYPIYTKRSSAIDWNVDNGNEDFISLLSDRINADDFPQLARTNEFHVIDEDDDKSNSFGGVNLKKKTWSLIEKDKKNDADGRQDRPEFDDSGVDDYDDYSEENFLSEIDALLAQPGTKKSSAVETKKSYNWMKQDRSLSGPAMHRSNNKASAPATFYEREFHHDGIPMQPMIERFGHPWKTMDGNQKRKKSSFPTGSGDVIDRKKRSVDAVTLPVEATFPPLSTDLSTEQVTPSPEAHSGNIRKKSIDWDDYFGFDKRSSDTNDAALEERMQNYLENEFYKSMGGPHHRRGSNNSVNDTLSGVEAKKRRSFNGQSKFDLESAEEEEDEEDEEEEGKASRAKEDPDSIDRRSSQLVANLINQLNEEDLKAATSQLTQQLLEAIREEILDDGRRYKYAAGPRQIKRVAHKKSLRKRAGFRPNLQKPGENDCAITDQVMMTCDSIGALMGGYRPILGEACYRYQACSICSVQEDELERCNIEFYQYTLAVCGDDLVCRSQSRRLLSGLFEISVVDGELFKDSVDRVQVLCRRDACLPAFWKRR